MATNNDPVTIGFAGRPIGDLVDEYADTGYGVFNHHAARRFNSQLPCSQQEALRTGFTLSYVIPRD